MTQGGAHLGLCLPGPSSSLRGHPVTQAPLSPPSSQQPTSTRPTATNSLAPPNPVAAQTYLNPQVRPIPVDTAAATIDRKEVIWQQNNEITLLRAQIVQLATTCTPAAQPAQPGPEPAPSQINVASTAPEPPVWPPGPPYALFMNEAVAEQARALLVVKAADKSLPKKASLPDIIPGFKASPLSLGEYNFPPCFRLGGPCGHMPLHIRQAGGLVCLVIAKWAVWFYFVLRGELKAPGAYGWPLHVASLQWLSRLPSHSSRIACFTSNYQIM
jgi:hypothetical protein